MRGVRPLPPLPPLAPLVSLYTARDLALALSVGVPIALAALWLTAALP